MSPIGTSRSGGLARLASEIRSTAVLLPIMAAVFISYLVAGIAMPVVPLHVHDGLGLGAFLVGFVAGSQFAASLVSRFWAGHHADRRGGKHAVVAGLIVGVVSGLLHLLSLRFTGEPEVSAVILLAGRAVLGGALSFIVGGALAWGLALMGPQNAGRVMAWIGIALYGAFAAGAPVGTALYDDYGFAAIALATMLIPLCTLPFVAFIRGAMAPAQRGASLGRVVACVWLPGVGLALGGVGFGAITTFIVLLFGARGWSLAWLALTALSIAFMGGRLVFGHLPDKVGGARAALVCAFIEAAGLALIWLAPWSALALVGATLTGLGYSLVYPGFGVEAVRRAPPQGRGLAMGAYTAFFDLSLVVASPALGMIADEIGLEAVFLVSALVVLCAAAIALRLLHRPPDATGNSATTPL